MSRYHIAQANIGRIKAPLADPIMSGFVNRLAEINTLADQSPGFLWRLLLDSGKFESRAALARYLGVSCARVPHLLRRLN